MIGIETQIIESPYVEEGSVTIFNPGKPIPPLPLGPDEVATAEMRISHLLKHGAMIVVKNLSTFKTAMGI